MALISRFAFFALLLLPYQCKAKEEDCSETQCRVLRVGDHQVVSDFRSKASEKGVRLVYINLTFIVNASYDPLNLTDVFLPHRWIWANTSHEPMLSLPEDYDMLSVGLLTYQVRWIDVKVTDEPSGCLAKLNSTCQNLAVGRMLLEDLTNSGSGDILHKTTPVVCVAVLNTTTTNASSKHDMDYRCCNVAKEPDTGTVIRCNEKIDVGPWVTTVHRIFLFFSFFLALFAPALPLALPDYVFNLEDEVEKENRQAEQNNIETTRYQCITNASSEGKHDNQRGAGRSNTEDAALPTVTFTATGTANNKSNNYNNDKIQEETGQNTSNYVVNIWDKEKETEFIPVDDSSPMNLSTLLRESVQKFPDVPLCFNIKLAVMCLCVYPCVLYVQIGLYYTLKKTSLDEIRKKHVQVDSVFGASVVFVKITGNYNELVIFSFIIVMLIAIFILVLFLKPKDFFLGKDESCLLCDVFSPTNDSFSLPPGRALRDEMHRHLKLLYHYLWYSTDVFGNIVVSIYYCLSLGCLRKKMRKESRGNHLFCVFFRLISFIFALPCIIVSGVFSLLIFIIFFIISLVFFSPALTVSWFCVIKILHIPDIRGKRAFFILIGILCLTSLYVVFAILLLANSCLFISIVVAYIIIGLCLNVSIVTPFLAFFLVLTTNLYLCYAQLQRKYKEVKKMILEKLRVHMNSDDPKGTIRREIYWFVCNKVLPVKSEVCRMLCIMAAVILFLLFALFVIVIFGNQYDISTLTTTISVFFSGSIPPLFLRILTTGNNIIGWEKIKMEREIDEAVKEYRGQ